LPGVDFKAVREAISLAQVLDLLGFVATERNGDQLRGPCPVHQSKSLRSRSFSANLGRNVYRCFKCGSSGNQLDLWRSVMKLGIHEAATDLCERLAIEIPRIVRHASRDNNAPQSARTEKRNP
jgi:DNA primase